MNKYSHFDHTEVFSSLSRAGYPLGEKKKNALGDFILSETKEDLTKGQALMHVAIFSVDDVTYDHTAFTMVQADAGATIAAGRLAGCILHITDDSGNVGYTAIVKKNTAGKSGAAITITLHEALPTDITENTDIDISVFDPNYVEIIDSAALLGMYAGQAPVDVDQSDKPYFWRQVSGIAPALQDAAIAAGKLVIPSNATEGNVEVIADMNLDLFTPIGIGLSPAPAANKLGLIKLL